MVVLGRAETAHDDHPVRPNAHGPEPEDHKLQLVQ
jgi:hypothetical protein